MVMNKQVKEKRLGGIHLLELRVPQSSRKFRGLLIEHYCSVFVYQNFSVDVRPDCF